MAKQLARLALFSDASSIDALLNIVPGERIGVIVGASIRPASQGALRARAEEIGVPFLIQPRVSEVQAYATFAASLAATRPDGLICHSYAMRVQPDILTLIEGHAFNMHPALLPKNRGPNPMQWALIHGDTVTGVTLHVMKEGFDTGPIVAQDEVAVAENDTWVTLTQRLSAQSDILLARVVPSLLEGSWQTVPQDEMQARTNPRISPESFPIDFSRMSDKDIHNLIRAQVAPLAGAYFDSKQGRIRFADYIPLAGIPALREAYA